MLVDILRIAPAGYPLPPLMAAPLICNLARYTFARPKLNVANTC